MAAAAGDRDDIVVCDAAVGVRDGGQAAEGPFPLALPWADADDVATSDAARKAGDRASSCWVAGARFAPTFCRP